MKFTEVVGDLFSVGSDYVFAHCIGADYALGAGIAVEFVKRFDMRRKLMAVGTHEWPDVIRIGSTYNLVTKQHSSGKPTYEDFQGAIDLLSRTMITDGTKKLAIPLLGCGLDGLEWDKVKDIVQKSFSDTDIDIIAFHFPK